MGRRTGAAGFTLIEISLVLVIIGLLAGGVLVGQDLIRASTERAELAQFERLTLAANTFKGKYGAMPGDFKNATDYFSASRLYSVVNGNGDGVFQQLWGRDMTANSGEWYLCGSEEIAQFYAQLSAAGMIGFIPNHSAGDGSETAANLLPASRIRGYSSVYTAIYNGPALNGAYGVTSAIGQNVYVTGIDLNIPDFDSVDAMRYAWDAVTSSRIDRKIDDGNPLGGSVRASCWDHAWNIPIYDVTPGQLCRQTSGNPCVNAAGAYDTVNNPMDCGLRINAGF